MILPSRLMYRKVSLMLLIDIYILDMSTGVLLSLRMMLSILSVVFENIELSHRRAGVTFLCTRVLSGSLDIILPLDESVAGTACDIRLGGTDTPTTALGST